MSLQPPGRHAAFFRGRRGLPAQNNAARLRHGQGIALAVRPVSFAHSANLPLHSISLQSAAITNLSALTDQTNFCLTTAGLVSATLHSNQRASDPSELCRRRLCEARGFLVGVFDMARFVEKPRPSWSHRMPLAAPPSFSKFLFPLSRGAFFPATKGMGLASNRLSGNAETFAVMPHARRKKTGFSSKPGSTMGEASGIRRDTDGDHQKKAYEKQNFN